MLSKNRIRELQQLHLRKHRDAQRLFVIEGVKSVTEVVRERPSLVKAVFAVASFIEKYSVELTSAGIPFTEISETELSRISMQPSPNQVLAVCHYFEEAAPDISRQPFTFYLDDIRDPGNLGTIIRIADWFGVKKIFCSPESCEIYNPKALQASMGSFLRVAIGYSSLADLVKRENVGVIYGAALDGANLFTEKLARGVIVIGNEANGIQPDNMKLVTRRITIPSGATSRAESLNAAMATAIFAAEFFRRQEQRDGTLS